jgi:GAF domain-containing protein
MDMQILQNTNESLESFLNTPGEPGDLHGILKHILQTALKLFEADSCFCIAFHPTTERLMEHYSMMISSQQQSSTSRLGSGTDLKVLAEYVLHHRGVVVENVDENKNTAELHHTFMHAHNIRSFAATALCTRRRKRPLAILYLNYRQKDTFNQREQPNLRQFALLAAALLQEAWLSWRYREISLIGYEINRELSNAHNLFEHLCNHIGNIVNSSDIFQLTVYHSHTNTWDIYREINGHTSIELNAIPDELSRSVTHSGQPLFVKHFSKETRHPPSNLKDHAHISHARHIGNKEATIAVPLQLRELTLGALLLQHQQADTYNEEDLFTLRLLANHIALALSNIRLHNNLSQLDRTGQIITQQLESDNILQATVDNVRGATMADVVILFLFDHNRGRFQLPPSVSGQLRDPDSLLLMSPRRSDDIAELMLHREEPLFVKQSPLIAEELLADQSTRTGNFAQREEIASTAAIPLRVNHEIVGVLFVNFRLPQRFDSPQKLLIEGLGHYIAVAIKNAQIFEKLRLRRISEFGILQHVERELNRMLDLQSVLDKILELAEKQIDANIATIALYDTKKHEFRIASAIGNNAEQERTYTIPLHAHSLMRWVMDHKQSIRSNNVHTETPWREIYFPTNPDTVSELDVPLLDGDDFVGIINFEHSKEGAFNSYDQVFLETLAGQTVLAVKKAQAYENEKRLVQEAQLLNEISKEITSQLHFEHVFGLILEKAIQLTEAAQGALVLYDRETDILCVVDSRGMRDNLIGKVITFDQGIVGHVARTREMVNVDPREEPWNSIFLDWVPNTRSELAIPMLAGDELRGVLNFESPELNHFDERDVRLLKALAALAVVALQNAERYAKAQKDAERFALLYRIGQDLSNISEVSQQNEAFTIVHNSIVKCYSYSHVIIRRYTEESQQLSIVCHSPQDLPMKQGTQVTEMSSSSSLNIEHMRAEYIVHDITAPAHTYLRSIVHDQSIRSIIIIPTCFKNRYYGRLELYHHEVSHFREPDVQFIRGLSHQLASTLYRIQTNQERQEFETRVTVAEAMSTIGQSAFELTHRLGNDLGLVPTYVEAIQSELEQQGIHNHHISKKLGDIRHSAQTVLALSKKLKSDLSDMKKRDQHVGEAVSISPGVLFVDAISAVSEIPKEIELCLEIDSDAPHVKVQPDQGADILRNLITNAIEAMPYGGILTLRTRVAGRMVALDVSDTGIGIPEDAQKKIFDLFVSTKRSSGFGLWSAKRYALENHGDLTVESVPEAGSTFTLTLPRV